MSGWWVHSLWQQGLVVELISWIYWVIFSITMHELAHGWAAIWQGDDTPRRMGRMTANPVVHMGQWSLIVFALIGIAWGVMPVDPSRFRWGRRGRVLVSGAGPAMNLALAGVVLTLLVLWIAVGPTTATIYGNVATFLLMGGWLNLLLAFFNLLPIPPLDGASIVSGLSLRAYQFYHQPRAQLIGMFVFMIVLLSGCGGLVFTICRYLAEFLVDLGGLLFGNPPVLDVLAGP